MVTVKILCRDDLRRCHGDKQQNPCTVSRCSHFLDHVLSCLAFSVINKKQSGAPPAPACHGKSEWNFFHPQLSNNYYQ
jgi:hypothetical protein